MRNFFYYLKYIGLFLILVAAAFLTAFGARRYTERQQQLKIMAAFEASIEEKFKDIHEGQEYLGATSDKKVYFTNETFAILELEELNIKVSIVEGIDKDALRLSAGHFPGTAFPGEGNFVIAGHSSFVYTCLFNDMHKAKLDNIITVKTKDGTITYKISEIYTTSPYDLSVLENTDESILTIVTCTSDGTERLIIKATQIEE